ncbi:DoxX family protein [Coraliomargarita parva]|uniref:DoxX family protein n=1 Tax=Coraliomargarita parva TaxID=3014050 RepID=UPI0022B41760|nr:DoxX family protein [Coraliomargarita parva]
MNTTIESNAPLAAAAANESSSSSKKLLSILAGTSIRNANLADLGLRLGLATVLFPHGAQKLLGWFGGYGFSGTMGFLTGTMNLPWIVAFSVILVEFFAPVLLVLGLFTRTAAIAIGAVMTGAMLMVHAQNGFFMNWFGNQAGEGIEYFLLILGLVAGIAINGAGKWALDAKLFSAKS